MRGLTMKLIQAYSVGNELFRTHQEALARERELALRKLINGMDIHEFTRKFCHNEEFRKNMQEISDMGVVEE